MLLNESNDCIKTSLEFEQKIQRYMFNKYGPDNPLMDMMFELRGDLKPFPEYARASVNIPVAGHQESKNIYRSLLSYSGQGENLDDCGGWDTFEINLFVNAPEPTTENTYSWDETLHEIERFRVDFPHIHINLLQRRLEKNFLDIGIIRAIITDVHLLRIGAHPDHVIISHDADQIALHPRYIRNIIDIFEDTNVQIFGGRVDDDPVTFLNHPDVFILERFKQFRCKSVINTPGANSAYRASAYVQVGGYQAVDGKCGEDNNLGQKIFTNSWDKLSLGYYGGNGRVLRVTTHGRRLVGLVMQHGKIPGRHAWEEVYEDGTSGIVDFGPDDVYRSLQLTPDFRKLSAILQDDISWHDFLKNISPHIFKKIGFHTIDGASVEFASAENLAQTLYGTDATKQSQIHETFSERVQVVEYNPVHNEELFAKSPLKVLFPLRQFPDEARRAFMFLGIEEIRCVIYFYPDPIAVLIDFEITRADKLKAGLQKFLEKMKKTPAS